MNTQVIHGHCEESFLPVREVFARNFEEGLELGASYAVSVEGEMVVDLWGGFASVDRLKPWDKDTIVQVSSTSKVIVSLCGLLLIDRGLIALDEPVATYWPEFAQNGKEKLPVRYLFCHASGLAGLDGMPGIDIWSDWNEVVTRLAAQKPWWEPGTISGYHAFSYGHLIGELVRRTTGKTISRFFREELGDPLGIDFYLGLPESEFSRPAEIEDCIEFPSTKKTTSTYYRALGYMTDEPENYKKWSEFPPWTQDIPSGNGVGNARSLAQIGSLLAMGGLARGKRYFSEETGKLPYQEQIYTFDKVMYAPVRWGLGFALASKEIPLPYPNAFHWGGSGGSAVVMVPEHGASWAYVPNRFSSHGAGNDVRADNMAKEVIKCLG